MSEVNLANTMENLMANQLGRQGVHPDIEVSTKATRPLPMVEKLPITKELSVDVIRDPLELPHEWIKLGTELVSAWSDWAARQETTWMSENYSVVSPVARIDCTLGYQPDGSISIVPYEVETRPSGLGVAVSLSDQVRSNLDNVRSWWHESVRSASLVVEDGGVRLDDHLWLKGGELSVEEAEQSDGLLLVRNDSNNGYASKLLHLRDRAIAPVSSDGSKTHAEAMGMATLVRSEADLDEWIELLQDTGTVIKPAYGAYSKGVSVHSPASKSQRPHGTVTTSRLKRDALEMIGSLDGAAVLQPLVPPLDSGIPSHPNQVLRLYWANTLNRSHSPTGDVIWDKRWIPLGGVAVSRNNIRVHGASDAITQPVEIVGGPQVPSKAERLKAD